MNYELAQKLKDAGFPIRILGEEELGHMEDPDDCPFYIPTEEDEDGTVYCTPTLSELIEACGNEIHRLWRVDESYDDGKTKWCATGTNDFNDGTGTTPEEAVARLWLALNK